jgi:hypothetical protein
MKIAEYRFNRWKYPKGVIFIDEDVKSKTSDKYTIIFERETVDGQSFFPYAVSNNCPFHPSYGIFQHAEFSWFDKDQYIYSAKHRKIRFDQLPLDVQKAVLQDLADDGIK